MGTTLTAEFETRRAAEMAVEMLVQDHGIERTDIFISAVGDQNTVGTKAAGADVESGHQDVDSAPALNGVITVSIDLENMDKLDIVRSALNEFSPSHLVEN